MTGSPSSRWRVLAAAVCLASPSVAFAQHPGWSRPEPVTEVADVAPGELAGVVRDSAGQPLAGVVVSAIGSTTAFAVSDRDGRFLLRGLPAGPYLIRAHLQGYVPARGRLQQIAVGTRSTALITLTRQGDTGAPAVLEAGVGGSGTTASAPRTAETEAEHDHGELAWRLRHARRSVLREATASAAGADGAPGDDEPSLFGESVGSLARAVDTSARLATALFADLELQGQLNLLTSASFDRPEELFSSTAGLPRSVAYLALSAPAARGEWRARGAITQGDLSSWLVAGTFTSQSSGAHAYEAGFSYGMQRYFGANAEALAALRDGSRNAAAVYAYDTWRLTPRVRVGFGGEYASYDYLPQAALLSPRISVSVKPVDGDPLLLRATVAHRETAPGAVEFRVPDGDVWVPPERTFSAVSAGGFRPERLDHVEVGAERQLSATTAVGVRVFRQRVQDQAVTVFGSSIAQSPSQTGHYYVGSAGDVEALGWGVTFTREVADGVRASLDYTQAATEWVGASLDRAVLARFAGSALRAGERLHDLTASIESVVPVTATRLFVVYKLNTAFSSSADSDLPGPGARFNVQISQSLPFLKFTSARWEALVAVRNVFTEDVSNASVYDELLVVRPPKRVLGGVTVKF